MNGSRRIFLAVFVASLSSLAYEITLIRVFAVTLWYHFAFMVISIAMLGIAASGTFLAVYPNARDLRYLPRYFGMLSLGIPASYLLVTAIPFEPARLSWDEYQILYIGLYYLVLSFPFFSFGLIMASAFSAMQEKAGQIYGADLLGAGMGSLFVLGLMYLAGPDRLVFVISSIASLSLIIHGKGRLRLLTPLILLFNFYVLVADPAFCRPRISPFKPLEQALRFPGAAHLGTSYSPFARVDLFRSPAARYAPGLSLRYLEELPAQTGISVDAGEIHSITDSADRGNLGFLSFLPSALPYETGPRKDVLVLEPKAGLPVLMAEFFGAEKIMKIDSNPLVIRTVRDYAKGSPEVYLANTRTGLGRSWLSSTDAVFDLIDISLLGAMASGSFGFSEDYRFTSEAVEEYLGHTGQEGLLAFHLFILPPPRTELRLLATLCAALEKQGVRECGEHIAAIRSWDTVTILAKKTPLTAGEIAAVRNFARERRFDLVHYPGITPGETNLFIRMASGDYAAAFGSILNRQTRKDFTEAYLFDIRPVHDENPFPHYFLRLGNIREIYRVMGSKWQYFIEEGYLLPVVFIQVGILGLILMALPSLGRKGLGREKGVLTGRRPVRLVYFAFLGVAYLFVEVSFVQKMILPLEHPSYAAAAVLSSVLIGSGMGSLLSQRYAGLRDRRIILILTLMIFLYSMLLSPVIHSFAHFPLPVKLALAFLILIPAGMCMGIPFPLGISLLEGSDVRLIPWAWAVNGCMSVLSPVMALMLAIGTGFKTVLLTGMVLYLLAFVSLRVSGPSRSHRPSAQT